MSLGDKLVNMNKRQKVDYINGVLAEFRNSDAYHVLDWALWRRTSDIMTMLADESITADKRQFHGGQLSSMKVIAEIIEVFKATKSDLEKQEEQEKRRDEQIEKEKVDTQLYTSLGASIF